MDSTTLDISPVGDRYCRKPTCKKLLTIRPEEQPSKFVRRVHCDEECSKTNPDLHKAQSERFAKERAGVPKKCTVCDKKFYRRNGESRTTFNNRPTCGRKCGDALKVNRKQEEIDAKTKICEYSECKKPFKRHKNGKNIESRVRFASRKTCSVACNSAKRAAEAKRKRTTSGGSRKKKPVERLLPPSEPMKFQIPDAPPPPPAPIWRPANIGRDIRPRVSQTTSV